MAQLIAVAARTIVPSRMLRLLPRTPVCPTHVLGQPVVCVLCVCHLRIFFHPLSHRYTVVTQQASRASSRWSVRNSSSSMRQSPFILPLCTGESTSIRLMCVKTTHSLFTWPITIHAFKGFWRTKGDRHSVTVDVSVHIGTLRSSSSRSRGQKSSRRVQSKYPLRVSVCACVCVWVCVCVYVYRANHCPSASADPPARVSRARSKLSPPE